LIHEYSHIFESVTVSKNRIHTSLDLAKSKEILSVWAPETGTGEEGGSFCTNYFENGVVSPEKMKIPMNLHLPPPSTTVLRSHPKFPTRLLSLERRQGVWGVERERRE
jgi:hypothetical protein